MMPGHDGGAYWCDQADQFSRLKWNRAMAILSPELSTSEMTGLLCAIILILIPLTIWAFYDLERLRRDRRGNHRRESIRAKNN